MLKKIDFGFLIPFIVIIIFVAINLGGGFDSLENRVYDLLLHIKAPVPERSDILLLDVDDIAIEKVGVWPWSRNIMGDGLVVMKEFGAKYAIFDIEYVNESPRGVNSSYLEKTIPILFQDEFAYIQDNFKALAQGMQSGDIEPDVAGDYMIDLSFLVGSMQSTLLSSVNQIARDNDQVLGNGAYFFENSFFTVTTIPDTVVGLDPDYEQWILDELTVKNVVAEAPVVYQAGGIQPAIPKTLTNAGGAGFPTVFIDEDGYRRRIDLLSEYKGKYFGQLVFRPLLHWLGDPTVIVKKNKIVLEKAEHPDGDIKDITIPLAVNNRMLLNWPKKSYNDSYRHMTYYRIYLHDRQEENLIANLRAMDDAGYTFYYDGASDLLTPFDYADNIKQEILSGMPRNEESFEEYRNARDYFFEEVGIFLNGDAETQLIADIDALLESPDESGPAKTEYIDIREGAIEFFSASKALYDALMNTKAVLRSNLKDAFCIIGWTATSTTDIGVNPFDKEYINVGTHATVLNTILSGQFLDNVPWWYGAVIAALMAIAFYFVVRKMEALPSLLIGTGIVTLLIAAGVAIFLLTGVYVNLVTPSLIVFITFLSITFMKFILTAREKSYIRNAFGHYLSADVINELLSDPEKLALGGDKKYMTAIFTDVKSFSTISEKLDPSDLVSLLNQYLSGMSDIVLEQRGTIDKYEGDAIISFFGAPIEYDDHAEKACRSAVGMKRVEAELNKRFLETNLSPSPLLTRIGVNTGEMVVGNMGTATKMDYTIMGNSVNLAARLEGVNKQYGTWVLVSETTQKEAGDEFLFRRLDRVRVVGINEPVRLYELVDEKAHASSDVAEAVGVFDEGINHFESKDWVKAEQSFKKVLAILKTDGPAETYLKRCKEYRTKPPSATWDGVFNLTSK